MSYNNNYPYTYSRKDGLITPAKVDKLDEISKEIMKTIARVIIETVKADRELRQESDDPTSNP